ncbi:MAG TPA: hypothetical protein VD963_01115 [Phycisphaerales bacterium]|nr:hypothetical protein [Phycisphaerales bacterium]
MSLQELRAWTAAVNEARAFLALPEVKSASMRPDVAPVLDELRDYLELSGVDE